MVAMSDDFGEKCFPSKAIHTKSLIWQQSFTMHSSVNMVTMSDDFEKHPHIDIQSSPLMSNIHVL
jgi:hypothetical protein